MPSRRSSGVVLYRVRRASTCGEGEARARARARATWIAVRNEAQTGQAHGWVRAYDDAGKCPGDARGSR